MKLYRRVNNMPWARPMIRPADIGLYPAPWWMRLFGLTYGHACLVVSVQTDEYKALGLSAAMFAHAEFINLEHDWITFGTAIVGIEARPPKVRPFVLTPELVRRYHWYRVPDATVAQRRQVVLCALARVNEPYGYRKAAKAAAMWVMRKLGLVKLAAQRVHCDELVIDAWRHGTGINITPHIAPELALPDDIARGGVVEGVEG